MSLRTRLLALPLVLALAGAPLLVAPAAHADDRRCAGTLRAVQVSDNIVVPRGRTCRLIGTRVDGDVKVRAGATLVARGVRVKGNIQSQRHRLVRVTPRTVNNTVRRSFVDGNIQLEQGRGGGVVNRTVVDGDIQLFSNDGRFTVRRNVVDGNLQCKNNDPRPIGGGNRVQGNKEGQCRSL